MFQEKEILLQALLERYPKLQMKYAFHLGIPYAPVGKAGGYGT